MVEAGGDTPERAEPESGDRRAVQWQRRAAFLCFGMAVGAPAAQSLDAIRFLPGERSVEAMLALPVFVIAPVAIARVIAAPFIDALGRRRRWVAILIGLVLLITLPILALAPSAARLGAPTQPLDYVLMLAAMLVAGALLAAVDGLRSVTAPERAQGGLAAAQYLGTIIPAALLPVFLRAPDSLTISVFLCAFIVAAWLGLWLLPRREVSAPPLFERPELAHFLDAEQNLSRGGKAVTAWLYGVFVCPVADFFRRFGGLAWAILAVLVLGDLATHLDTRHLLTINAGILTSADVTRIGSIRSVAQFSGAVFAGWLVWQMGAARGLAASFLIAGAAALAGIGATVTAPSLAWFIIALAIGALAQGAILVGFIAFIARVVAPAYAAWQFTLLWLAGLPTVAIVSLRTLSVERLGSIGTYVVFLVLLAVSILLTLRVARRLDAPESRD
jgi:hypothetical protein